MAKKVVQSALRKRAPRGIGRITHADTVRRIERQAKVFALRRDGCTNEEIAGILNCGIHTVREDVKSVLSRMITETGETVEEHRQLVLARTDSLLQEFMPQTRTRSVIIDDPQKPGQKREVVIPASLNAADFILKVDAARRKLLALDVPETKDQPTTAIRVYVGVDMDRV